MVGRNIAMLYCNISVENLFCLTH